MLTHELSETVGNPVAPVARPQIRREIDGAGACFTNAGDPLSRRAMRQRTKNEHGVGERRLLGCDEVDCVPSEARLRTALVMRRGERELELGMVEDE